ncbi:hypothetical protein NGRA_2875 [Nosema granulosis]|uniref:Uncharacterized protein n=1 Tax=Nosema granulosis TaxID=83296 RepID=A0A9P6GVU6_9MICR|nr:hypothetical protein NGRA_2875 [Nosema granulosis]
MKELDKFRNPYYFKKYESFDDYLTEQLNIHIDNKDLLEIKNNPSLENALSRINSCSPDSIEFYAKLFLFSEKKDTHKVEFFKILVKRFEEENDGDNKLRIYNILRLIINFLGLEEVGLVEGEVLSILIGEYARKKGLGLENILENKYLPQNSNYLPQKFLGYNYAAGRLIGNLDDLVKYTEMDMEVLKVVAYYCDEESKIHLERLLESDRYLQYYIKHCEIDLELLKKIPTSQYNSYSLYLLIGLFIENQEFCSRILVETNKLDDLFILFSNNEDFLVKYQKYAKGILRDLILNQQISKTYCELRTEIVEDEYLDLQDPIKNEDFERTFEYTPTTTNYTTSYTTNYHFGVIKRIQEENNLDNFLNILDDFLYENYKVIEIKAYLEGVENISISKWLKTEEIYFSLVVERCPILREFHRSFMLNKKMRTQLAHGILSGPHRNLFLEYLDKRGIYVDLQGVIEYNFSTRWLKMFIEENYKKCRIENSTSIVGQENGVENSTSIVGQENGDNILDKILVENGTITLKLQKNKSEELRGLFVGNRKILRLWTTNYKSTDIPRKKNKESVERKRIIKLNKKELLDSLLEERGKEFTRFGLLNQFVSANIDEIEECAKVSSMLIQNQAQFSKFLNTLSFVIEEKMVLEEFIFHFLRQCNFTFKMSSIEKYLKMDNPQLVVLISKVEVSEINNILNRYTFSEDIIVGMLLRSYAYLLYTKKDVSSKFRKVKDGEITFYYRLGNYIELRYKSLVISYLDTNFEEYLNLLRGFADTNCTFRKAILKRNLNILQNKIELNKQKILALDHTAPILEDGSADSSNSTGSSEDITGENVLEHFSKDPEANLDLLRKIDKIPRFIIFDLLKLLRVVRGTPEDTIFEILKGHLLDPEMCLYALSGFGSFGHSSKIRIVGMIDCKDQRVFLKMCETIANEDNLQVLRVLLTNLRDKGSNFDIIENWKNNYKLKKLLVRIYPLSLQDKKYYSEIFQEYKYEDEKEMLQEIFNSKI